MSEDLALAFARENGEAKQRLVGICSTIEIYALSENLPSYARDALEAEIALIRGFISRCDRAFEERWAQAGLACMPDREVIPFRPRAKVIPFTVNGGGSAA